MKLNHSVLIVSVAAALIIVGIAFALSFQFDYVVGLVTGLAAFVVLIVAMLILNRRKK